MSVQPKTSSLKLSLAASHSFEIGEMMTDQEVMRMARLRTNAKLGFYVHASIFVVVMLMLFAINAMSSSQPWSVYPFLGWGLGLAIHGIMALGVVGSGFKDQMLQAEVARVKSERGTQT